MTTRVLVLSDTHCDSMAQLNQRIVDVIRDVDAIIHAGDYTQIALVEELSNIKAFYGVHGNMDSYEVKNRLPGKLVVSLEGFKIGVAHPPEGGPPYGIKRRVKSMIGENVEAIVFGHTHRPEVSTVEGVLFMNPGSAKPSIFHPQTFILLEVSDKLYPKIVKI